MKKLNVFVFRKYIVNLCIAGLLVIIGLAVYFGVNFSRTEQEVSAQNAIYQGDTSSNKISLMVNVCWGSEYLADMLQTLEEKNAKVTFFVGGTWVAGNEDILIEMVEKGHELGNHAYSHKDHDELTRESSKKEISTTHNLIKSVTGVEPTLFAPPSGAYNNTTVEVASELGYKTIMWTRDTIDWRDQDVNLIYNRAVEGAKGGDLILMHPTACTKDALGKIIDTLQSKGFELVTVSENLAGLEN